MIKLEKPRLVEFYPKMVYFYLSRKYHRGINGVGKEYESYNCKAISIGFPDPKWFEKDDWYYDGHWGKGYTICGISFQYMDFYTYELL